MKINEIKVKSEYFESGYENITSYCSWLKRKNNVALHLIESYIGKDMREDERLLEIRNVILDVSGDIARLPYKLIMVSEENEKL